MPDPDTHHPRTNLSRLIGLPDAPVIIDVRMTRISPPIPG